jgi:hypothetical protein
MKKLLAATILTVLFLTGTSLAMIIPGESVCEAAEVGELNIPVKQLRAAPLEDANVVYEIPITTELLDISSDGNWFKVKISYAIGPFSYTYVGWTQIPVAKILAERQAMTPDIASLIEEK